MVTQKAMIAVMIVWLASSIASLLKFAERKQLNGFAVVVSLLTPLVPFGVYGTVFPVCL